MSVGTGAVKFGAEKEGQKNYYRRMGWSLAMDTEEV